MAVPLQTSQRSGTPVVPQRLRWHGHLAAAAIYALSKSTASTWRCDWNDESGLFGKDASQPVIFCTWHNRLALSMTVYASYVRPRGPGIPLTALISASRDGGLLAKTLDYYGVEAVRGSSSRRGRQALLELTSSISQGRHVAITPDGPRGPKYVVQEGIIALAQVTGLPIVPVSNHSNWKLRLKSWDQFQIPLPFARCRITLGKPLHIPRDATEADREAARQELQNRMQAITED